VLSVQGGAVQPEEVVDADGLARELLDTWYARAKVGDSQSPEFLAVVDKACVYRDARHFADIYRSCNILTVQELIDVERTRRELFEAYDSYRKFLSREKSYGVD
jgi:hypothetical protein